VISLVDIFALVLEAVLGFFVGLLSYAFVGGIASLVISKWLTIVSITNHAYQNHMFAFLLGFDFVIILGGILQHVEWLHDDTEKKVKVLARRLRYLEEKVERYGKEIGRIEIDLGGVMRDIKDIKDELEAR